MSIEITNKEPVTLRGYAIYRIKGEWCRTLRDFYDEISKVMHFPDYFGGNPDAFKDMLEDYDDYSESKNGVVIVGKAEHFLESEVYRYRMLEDIVSAFKRAELYRMKEAERGDRTASKLNLIFIVGDNDNAEAEYFKTRLQQMIVDDGRRHGVKQVLAAGNRRD